MLWVGSLGVQAVAEPARMVNLSAFRVQVESLQRVVAACSTAASACSAERVPADEEVSAAGDQAAFHAHWQWLREMLGEAGKLSTGERTAQMRTVAIRLQEMEAETRAGAGGAAGEGAAGEGANGEGAGGALADKAAVDRARSAARQVLAGDEFRTADGPTWIDKQVARMQDWFLRLFLGMDRIGARNPWLAPLIEWSCFGLAAGGLLFFVRRSLTRQALRISLGQASPARREDRDATDWQRLAEEHAGRAEWRPAVHCLYWAAIVSLETRRAWRANPTRTPREYLRLLRPGSAAQIALRELTRRFEQVWYGQTRGTEADFHAAQASFAAIVAADLKRSTPVPVAAVGPAAAGAA